MVQLTRKCVNLLQSFCITLGVGSYLYLQILDHPKCLTWANTLAYMP